MYFTIPEFVILGGKNADIPITPDLADKIVHNFMIPLNAIRTEIGVPIYITSGYRPIWWELYKGRSGDSCHTFIEDGASDLTVDRGWSRLCHQLDKSPFKRIAFYPGLNFFHVDYNAEQRLWYINKSGGWKTSNKEEILGYL